MAKELSEFSNRLTAAVKAEMARKGVQGITLAQAMGRNRNYVYERLRAEKPFTTDEIAFIADYLAVDPAAIFSAAEQEGER